MDSVVFRIGFAKTRLAARQMVSHGHILVNGRKVTSPSMRVKVGDIIEARKESLAKPLFADLSEKIKNVTSPSWLQFDQNKMKATVSGAPHYDTTQEMFDLKAVVEFYSR